MSGLLGTAVALTLGSSVLAILLGLGTLTALYCLLLTVVPDRFVGRLLLVPALLALLGTTGVPIGYMLITSVYDVGLTTFQYPWRFAGLANYLDLFCAMGTSNASNGIQIQQYKVTAPGVSGFY